MSGLLGDPPSLRANARDVPRHGLLHASTDIGVRDSSARSRRWLESFDRRGEETVKHPMSGKASFEKSE
jgi:hypothetical protein